MLYLMDVDRQGVAERYDRILDPEVLEVMRQGFNQMNKGMVPIWRLGLARMMNCWPAGGGRILILEHVGRKSGTQYRTPVNFAPIGDDIYVLAAFGDKTHWYRNLLAAPEMAVWLPDGRWVATVEDASDDDERLKLIRQVLIDSGFVAPLIGLHPRDMSDQDLQVATATYRVLRIRPVRKEDVLDGPGSLAWVWLVAGVAILIAAILRVVLRGASDP